MDIEFFAIKEQVELSCIVVCKWSMTLDVAFLLFFLFLLSIQYLDQMSHEWWQCDLQLCHKGEEDVRHIFIDSQVN